MDLARGEEQNIFLVFLGSSVESAATQLSKTEFREEFKHEGMNECMACEDGRMSEGMG
jgi:hypothetical protein